LPKAFALPSLQFLRILFTISFRNLNNQDFLLDLLVLLQEKEFSADKTLPFQLKPIASQNQFPTGRRSGRI
jgi:hypothetical protein